MPGRLDHAGKDGAGDVEEPLDVRVDHLFPVADEPAGQLVQAAGETGVVDQDVDGAPGLGQPGDGFVDGRLLAHVEPECMDGGLVLRLERFGQLLDPFASASAHQDLCSLGGEGPGRGLPDPGARAGDEDDLIFERQHWTTP